MTAPRLAGGLLPSHRLLLHAALDSGAAARDAWSAWRALRPAGPDDAERRLLPLVSWNLTREGTLRVPSWLAATPLATWGRFQARLATTEAAVAALQRAGLRVLALKGLPMALLHYPTPALRPMADVDLLVGDGERERALQVLASLGYRAARSLAAGAHRTTHSLGLADDGDGSLDLHWHALAECCFPGADADLWRSARQLVLGEAATVLAPDATGLLLTVCAHGGRWSPTPPLQWIADAALLVRGGAIEWGRLADEAIGRALSRRLAVALAWLRAELDLPVPWQVDARLRRAARHGERLELLLRPRPPSLLGGLLLHWMVHARRARAGVAPAGPSAFLAHLRDAWGLARTSAVPREAARRGLARLFPRTSGAA